MSESKLHDCHLLNNAIYRIKMNWKDKMFPREIPKNCHLSNSDRLLLNKELAAITGGIEFLYQTGFLVAFLKHSSEESKCASIYKDCLLYCTIMPF